MKKIEKFRNKSTKQLIELACNPKLRGRSYWKIIVELHKRGSKSEFNAAKNLAISPDPVCREVAADMLGQLGFIKQKFRQRSIKLLIKLLDDAEPDVIASAATALGHRSAREALPSLCKLRTHRKKSVRFGVVFGLLGQEDWEAVKALIDLSKDKTEDVRNWATFGLGSQIELDSPEIRKALEARIHDKNQEIRGEALMGLATRKHPNIVCLLKKALLEKRPITLYLEAAETLEDPSLLPELQKIKKMIKPGDNEYFISCLDDAIEACKQKKEK